MDTYIKTTNPFGEVFNVVQPDGSVKSIPKVAGNAYYQQILRDLRSGKAEIRNTTGEVIGVDDDSKTLPTPQEKAAAAFAIGIEIVSGKNPALNGTYSIDIEARGNISGIAASLALGEGFPLDAATLPYGDMTGMPHEFNQAEFRKFAKAVRDYVYRIDVAARTEAAGGPAEWPTLPVAID